VTQGNLREVSGARETSTARRERRLVLLAALLVWLSVALPLALGWETLYFRDVFNHFLPFKSFGVQALAEGEVPAINPTVGLGQPHRGDPGNLSFYPGNLLFLALPFWSALNLHYALHWLLAFVTFRGLARALGLSPVGAALAALTYAGSGWMLSNLSFHNLLVVAAWWPWVLRGGVVGGRRGVALGGLACGLALLGGEPVTACLGLVPLLALTVSRWGLRRGVLLGLAIGAVGLGIALPQLLAALRVMGFSQRVAGGVPPATAYSLHPARLFELLMAAPFGTPDGLGTEGFWAGRILRRPPFVLSLHFGVVALALAVTGALRRPLWAAGAGLGLLLAGLGRLAPEALFEWSGGLFRFPEKFLFWFALFVPLLAGRAVEEVPGEGGAKTPAEDAPGVRRAMWSAGSLAVLAVALLAAVYFAGAGMVRWLAAARDPGEIMEITASQLPRWFAALLLAVVLLALTTWAVRRRRVTAVLLLQALALLPLLQLIPTAETGRFRRPAPWATDLAAGSAVVSIPHTATFPRADPKYRLAPGSTRADLRHIRHLDLDFPTGVRAGLTYPLGPDAVGLHTPLIHLVYRRLRTLDDHGLLRWLRVLGTERVVRLDRPAGAAADGWRRVDRATRAGVPTHLYALERPAPAVWWPEELVSVASPLDAFQWVAETDDPVGRVAVPAQLDHRPGAAVRLVDSTPDRIEIEVQGEGGVLVVRRSFHPIYRAVAQESPLDPKQPGQEQELATLPVDLVLLGVQVPPGRQRVVLEVSAGPEWMATAVALIVFVLVALTLYRSGRGRTAAESENVEPNAETGEATGER